MIRRVHNERGTFRDPSIPDSHHLVLMAETFPPLQPIPAGERAAVGAARNTMCEAFRERALTMMDTHGTMRRPSIEGIKSMLLIRDLLMGIISGQRDKIDEAMMSRECFRTSHKRTAIC